MPTLNEMKNTHIKWQPFSFDIFGSSECPFCGVVSLFKTYNQSSFDSKELLDKIKVVNHCKHYTSLCITDNVIRARFVERP